MSFLNDFVGDVASDVLSAVSERLSSTAAINLIENLLPGTWLGNRRTLQPQHDWPLLQRPA